jgi:hypothetical protein
MSTVQFWAWEQIFLFTVTSTAALQSTHSPIQWVPEALSLGVGGQSVSITTHLHQVPKLRQHATSLHSTHTSSHHNGSAQRQLYLLANTSQTYLSCLIEYVPCSLQTLCIILRRECAMSRNSSFIYCHLPIDIAD